MFGCLFTLWGQGTLLSRVNHPNCKPTNEFKSKKEKVSHPSGGRPWMFSNITEVILKFLCWSWSNVCEIQHSVFVMEDDFSLGRETLWKDRLQYRCCTWTASCRSAQFSMWDVALLGHPHGCAAIRWATHGPSWEVPGCWRIREQRVADLQGNLHSLVGPKET